MALGKIGVPGEAALAGTVGPFAIEYNGCYEHFGKWCKRFESDCHTLGYTGFNLGISVQYKSRDDMDREVKHGNTLFESNANRMLFGWGLAWAFTITNDTDGRVGSTLEFVTNAASKYGLKVQPVRDKSSNIMTRYLMPSNVYYDTQIRGNIVYEGDVEGQQSSDGQSSVGSTAYFFSNQFKQFEESAVAEALRGERALANDEKVWNSVIKMVNASMRVCSSAPSGEFIAWYPDYWGLADNTVVLELDDIELINLTSTQSDSKYFSHVYCTGVDSGGSILQVYQSQGVVSIESDIGALMQEAAVNDSVSMEASDEPSYLMRHLINIPKGEEWMYSPKELYRRYGARPTSSSLNSVIEEPDDESGSPQYILPFLYALYSFMKNWAEQCRIVVSVTFNPSLLPGMRVAIPSLGVSFYIEEVTHNMNYVSGFTTQITAICPTGTLFPGMVNPSMDFFSNDESPREQQIAQNYEMTDAEREMLEYQSSGDGREGSEWWHSSWDASWWQGYMDDWNDYAADNR